MQIALNPAAPSDQPLVARMLRECREELARTCGDDAGEADALAAMLADYWGRPGRHALLIYVDGGVAGFALIERRCCEEEAHYRVAGFYVARSCRRRGLGRAAAEAVFARFPGYWEVATIAVNVPATAFWRGVIDRYTDGCYSERWLHEGSAHWIIQLFQV
ncbi:MAG TPA: GNAT family N-acetyltransferase [Roseiflexaceae bacterium]|nr:GNAT family N-acetyltransferase [Roseiflexaceae bacterium]